MTRFGLFWGFLKFSLDLQGRAGQKIQGFVFFFCLCSIVQSIVRMEPGSPASLYCQTSMSRDLQFQEKKARARNEIHLQDFPGPVKWLCSAFRDYPSETALRFGPHSVIMTFKEDCFEDQRWWVFLLCLLSCKVWVCNRQLCTHHWFLEMSSVWVSVCICVDLAYEGQGHLSVLSFLLPSEPHPLYHTFKPPSIT